MKKRILFGILAVLLSFSFVVTSCGEPPAEIDPPPVTTPSDPPSPPTAIDIKAIQGVGIPSTGANAATAVVETLQYTGTISWSPEVLPDGTFEASETYTATITLTVKPGFTLTGVGANFFEVAGAIATNAANSGVVTAVFPETNATPSTVVSIAAIGGVSIPTMGALAAFSIEENAQYTGTISWNPTIEPGGSFAASTEYTATITLTAKDGFTLNGVTENFFTVAGVTATNAANTGEVSAVFPQTAALNITDAAIHGVTPPANGAAPVTAIADSDQFTGTVTWNHGTGNFGASQVYTATITLTPKTGYTLANVTTNFFTVAGASPAATNAAGSGIITAAFPATGANAAQVITDLAIAGVTQPVTGATPATTITPTAQRTGTITWSPGDATFQPGITYTATIHITPLTDWTVQGVAANAFTVASANPVTNAANSGEVTAVFPATQLSVVSIPAIQGVTVPVLGATPVTTITPTAQYTGSVSWSPAVASTFVANQVYTATITLAPTTGFTFTGVAANVFTVAGTSTPATNPVNSGVITAIFPATGIVPVTGIPAVPTTGTVGTAITLPVQADPATATNRTITWAVTSGPGNITGGNTLNGTGAGTVNVTARIINGAAVGVDYTQNLSITFSEETGPVFVPVTGIEDLPSSVTIGSYALSGTVVPSNATNQTITWSVPNPGATGATIQGTSANVLNTVASGSVVVVATIANGASAASDFTKQFTVTVAAPTYPDWVMRHPHGVWNAGDIVRHNGKLWICLLANGHWEPGTIGTHDQWREYSGTSQVTTQTIPLPAPVLDNNVVRAFDIGDQFMGTAVWSVGGTTFTGNTFGPGTAYTATITLTTKQGYVFDGISANWMRVVNASSGNITTTHAAGSGTILTATVTYPATAIPTIINMAAITGVTPPVAGAIAAVTILPTEQYTGIVSWLPALNNGRFATGTQYTATITLTAVRGFTLEGVGQNFFTVAGTSQAATNSANSGVITARFAATGAIPVSGIFGVPAAAAIANPVNLPTMASPEDAANRAITWTMTGGTAPGRALNGNVVTVTGEGTVTLTGTVVNGTSPGVNYTQNFTINFRNTTPLTSPDLFRNGNFNSQMGTVPMPTVSGGTASIQSNNLRLANTTGTNEKVYTFLGPNVVDASNFTELVIEYSGSTNWLGGGVIIQNPSGTGTTNYTWWANYSHSAGSRLLIPLKNPDSSNEWGDSLEQSMEFLSRFRGFIITPSYEPNSTITVTRVYLQGKSGGVIDLEDVPVNRPRPNRQPATTFSTSQYNGVITWSPSVPSGGFQNGSTYTAFVTLTPIGNFSLDGVPQNFFKVNGATSVSNAANSGVITVNFPQVVSGGHGYPTPTRFIAITIDDGPLSGNTNRLLDVLDDLDVKTTMFLNGSNIARGATNPDIARANQRLGDGFHELACHGYTHIHLGPLANTNPAGFRQQLNDNKAALEGIMSSPRPIRWFRFPEYEGSRAALNIIAEYGYSHARASLDPRDWAGRSAQELINDMTSSTNAFNGAIYLLHDLGHSNFIEALPETVHRLRNAGVGFMTMSELSAHTGNNPAPGMDGLNLAPGTQWNNWNWN